MSVQSVKKTEIVDILKDISLIRVQYGNDQLVDINPVFIASEDTIDILANSGTIRDGVDIGSKVVCKFGHEGYEYIIDGEIANVCVYDPPTVSINVIEAKRVKDMRKDIRYETNLKSSVDMADGSRPIKCTVRNISRGGAGIVSESADIDRSGAEVYLSINLRRNKTVKLKAKVLRKTETTVGGKKYYSYGLQFQELSHEQSCQLTGIISGIVEGYEKLKRDSAAAISSAALRASGGRSRVVLIGNNPEVTSQIRMCLESLGIDELSVLKDIVFLRTYLEKEKPKIVVIDRDSSDGSGFKDAVTLAGAYPDIRFFLVCDYDDDGSRTSSEMPTNIELLYKPFINSEIEERFIKYI